MNLLRSTSLLAVLALVIADNLLAQIPATAPATQTSTAQSGRKSPHETISKVIGDRRTGNRITVTYGRPRIQDPKTGEPRKIWGGLVPWGRADRLGADEATLLITQQPLLIGEATIPAGAYTLYLIPNDGSPSKLAFSSNFGKWGIPVDETKDLARIDLKKTMLEKNVDQLTLSLDNDAVTGGGILKIEWENIQFSLPFTVKK